MRANKSKIQRVLTALSVIAMAVGLATWTVPTAHADEHDDAFIHALERDGIVPTRDPAEVVGWGKPAPDGVGRGVACSGFLGHHAQIVSTTRRTGETIFRGRRPALPQQVLPGERCGTAGQPLVPL